MVKKIEYWEAGDGLRFPVEEEAILYEAYHGLRAELHIVGLSTEITEYLRSYKALWTAMKEFIGATEHLHAPPPPARIFEVGEVQNAFKENEPNGPDSPPTEHFQIVSIGDDTP